MGCECRASYHDAMGPGLLPQAKSVPTGVHAPVQKNRTGKVLYGPGNVRVTRIGLIATLDGSCVNAHQTDRAFLDDLENIPEKAIVLEPDPHLDGEE